MAGIKRFFECLVPSSVCNIKCEYCYVIQEERRSQKVVNFDYTAEHIGQCLTVKRLGGVCYFSICAAGETLVDENVIAIVVELLKQGHFVNITTNGTLEKRFVKLVQDCGSMINRLHVSFSFHYLELKRKNMLDIFFRNVNYIRDAGASILVQLNLYDGYIPYLDEIKDLCMKNVGAYPQVAVTRYEEDKDVKSSQIYLYTKKSFEEYKNLGESFDSPLFKYTMENFCVKRREYCLAGLWTGCLNLSTGELSPCYGQPCIQNIFENPNENIIFQPVGKHCKLSYCVNSSHFMSLGVIPEKSNVSYAQLRNRKSANWYSKTLDEFLSGHLYDNNNPPSLADKIMYEFKYFWFYIIWIKKRIIKKTIGIIKHED